MDTSQQTIPGTVMASPTVSPAAASKRKRPEESAGSPEAPAAKRTKKATEDEQSDLRAEHTSDQRMPDAPSTSTAKPRKKAAAKPPTSRKAKPIVSAAATTTTATFVQATGTQSVLGPTTQAVPPHPISMAAAASIPMVNAPSAPLAVAATGLTATAPFFIKNHVRTRQTPTGPIPVPTPKAINNAECPIDWSLSGFAHLKSYHIELYKSRGGWNPTPTKSYSQVFKDYNEDHPEDRKSTEGSRKRFKNANKTIFLVTGIYFLDTLLGLEGNQKKGIAALVPEAVDTQQTKTASKPKPAPKTRKVPDYDGEVYQFSFQEPGQHTPSPRLIPLDDAIRASSVVAESIQTQRELSVYTQATPAIIDRFIGSICPHGQASLPSKIRKMCPDVERDDVYNVEEYLCVWSLDESFEVFFIAFETKCVDLLSNIVDFWWKCIHDEKDMIDSFKSGSRSFHDTTARDVIRMLSFKPEHINQLWSITEPEDPARTYWHDFIKSKGKVGAQTLLENYDEFSEDVLCDFRHFITIWFKLTSPLDDVQMTDIDSEITDTVEPDDFVFSDEITSKIAALQELVPLQRRTNIKLEDMEVSLELTEEGTGGDGSVYQDSEATDQDVVPTHDTMLVWSRDQEQRCRLYHYHHHIDGGCHRTFAAVMDTPIVRDTNGMDHVYPSKHVNITYQDQQYSIQNHTVLSEYEFKMLPTRNPTWEWHTIRSVQDYRATREDGSSNQGHRIDPYPVAFNPKCADDQGRFPNHPGYSLGVDWNTHDAIDDILEFNTESGITGEGLEVEQERHGHVKEAEEEVLVDMDEVQAWEILMNNMAKANGVRPKKPKPPPRPQPQPGPPQTESQVQAKPDAQPVVQPDAQRDVRSDAQPQAQRTAQVDFQLEAQPNVQPVVSKYSRHSLKFVDRVTPPENPNLYYRSPYENNSWWA